VIKASSLKPLGRDVLAEAIYGPETTEGGLWIPPEARDRYPNLGLVMALGPETKEDILPGDLAIFNTETTDITHTYMDYFAVHLRDGEEILTIYCSIDVEPIFSEQMRIFRENPSTEDRKITLKNIEDGLGYQFLASDVLDWTIAPLPISGDYRLEYINTRMLYLLDEEDQIRRYYLIDEREILAILREERKDGSTPNPPDTDQDWREDEETIELGRHRLNC